MHEDGFYICKSVQDDGFIYVHPYRMIVSMSVYLYWLRVSMYKHLYRMMSSIY